MWMRCSANIAAFFSAPRSRRCAAFFEYCEANWQEMEKDKAKADAALALFATAQTKADGRFGLWPKRIALVDDFLKGLRNKSQQLGQKRGPVPVAAHRRATPGASCIDGKLDERYWQECPGSATCRLRELQTGRAPTFGTTVKAGVAERQPLLRDSLRRAARREAEHRHSTKKDDAALWYGDAVEVLLETESHSYYQIAINPSGTVADLDRSAPKNAWFTWDSQAEVATQIADDHWTAEIRIPVTQDENDPLHQVIGRKPTASLPWHINICRQRIRDNGAEHSAFSPTGTDNFHSAMKFAHFYLGRSSRVRSRRSRRGFSRPPIQAASDSNRRASTKKPSPPSPRSPTARSPTCKSPPHSSKPPRAPATCGSPILQPK